MIYTFQISDVSPQSESIINLLLSLSKDYDFLNVIDKDDDLSPEQGQELDRRYEEFLKNPENGRPWNEVMEELLR